MSAQRECRRVSLLVTDLDNTLYDWFDVWHASYEALLHALAHASRVPRSLLEREIRTVHQRRRTSEYTYLLDELPSLRALHPGEKPSEIYAEALHRFRSSRKQRLHLYPTVMRTLLAVKRQGVPIIAYTESLSFHAASRLRALGLDGIVDYLYSPTDHDLPEGVSFEDLRTLPPDRYGLRRTQHRHTPLGHLKPDVAILKEIVDELGVLEETAYVGDSLMKDVAMARNAGVIDVLAQYGAVQHLENYELLRRLSHWSDSDVEREKEIMAQPAVEPSYVLNESFGELLSLFTFGLRHGR